MDKGRLVVLSVFKTLMVGAGSYQSLVSKGAVRSARRNLKRKAGTSTTLIITPRVAGFSVS